jgi:Fis family transcriptional regulator
MRAGDGWSSDLDGERPCAIYDMVMNSVEKPLLEIVLHRLRQPDVGGAVVGVNRNTLRKKMKDYGIK